jgi:hypothetical protein
MEQLKGFTDFDQEQSWKRLSLRRKQQGIRCIQLAETQEWLFSTDLDEEIDNLLTKLETTPCH